MPKFVVFDLEADGFAYQCTKLHVLAYAREDGQVMYTNDPVCIAALFAEPDTLFICHNVVTFDKVVLLRLLGIDIPYHKLVDSLALSWYLYPNRPKHGLASWGEDFGVPKPEVDDWEELTYEQYVHRCAEDTKINFLLWKQQWVLLNKIYDNEKEALRLIGYLSFKMDCLREQEELGWPLDYYLAIQYRDQLAAIVEEKKAELIKAMPLMPVKTKKKRPATMHKKDGSLSKRGEDWIFRCQEAGVCPDATQMIEFVRDYKPPNPGSHQQVKAWLYSLGWEPCTHDIKRNPDNTQRKIPQVRKEGELTESVKLLIPEHPHVGILDGLTVSEHRRAIFQGMLDSAELQPDGTYKVVAGASGLTNTLRLRHRKPLVNLPGVDKAWGKEVRGVLYGNLVGCDLVSLEDTTKRHYMQCYDPAYVNEMQQPGYDPHLSLALFAGVINQSQYDNYNSDQKELKAIRAKYKVTNYSATYGIMPAKLGRTLGIPSKDAKKLLDAFWKKNWSIESISKNCKVKKVGKDKWLYNPVSGFYCSLRHNKDRFSTLNQSTGVYVFDTFLCYCRSLGMKTVGQFHDEFVGINEGPEVVKSILEQAAVSMNQFLSLNVPIKYDYEIGTNYAGIH